jgi:hypothetical protein
MYFILFFLYFQFCIIQESHYSKHSSLKGDFHHPVILALRFSEEKFNVGVQTSGDSVEGLEYQFDFGVRLGHCSNSAVAQY